MHVPPIFLPSLVNSREISAAVYAEINEILQWSGDRIRDTAISLGANLNVRHMTSVEIDASPNVTCKPNYSQVYQPPLTLGGSGRVINVKSGEWCND